MFFQKRDVYPSNVWFITATAFKGLDFWEIITLKSAPMLHLIYYAIFETLFFIPFGSFSMFIKWYCIKRLFSSTLCLLIFLIFCIVIVISKLFLAGDLFQPDFAAIRRKKFVAQYFWFKVKLKQKKFIPKGYSVTSTWEIKISQFYFWAGNHWSFLRRRAS